MSSSTGCLPISLQHAMMALTMPGSAFSPDGSSDPGRLGHHATYTDENRRDLLELFDDRYDRRSTLVTGQMPVDNCSMSTLLIQHWQMLIPRSPDPGNSHRLELRLARSIRKIQCGVAGEAEQENCNVTLHTGRRQCTQYSGNTTATHSANVRIVIARLWSAERELADKGHILLPRISAMQGARALERRC